MERSSWDSYFMRIVQQVATRSTCSRRQVGAVAVRNHRILATGYNGAPGGLKHCAETGCLRQKMNIPSGERHEICRALHSEQNLILQAATGGLDITGADIYCTTHPCVICAKLLIGCKVNKIYYLDEYCDPLAKEMLQEAGIETQRLQEVHPGEFW